MQLVYNSQITFCLHFCVGVSHGIILVGLDNTVKGLVSTFSTSIVSKHLARRDNNQILRTHPPQASSTEENLPRHMHRTLAQLRTNNSPFLLSYLHKIEASIHPTPFCPLCRTHEHTTHLFSCPQIHTTLLALNLWRDPLNKQGGV